MKDQEILLQEYLKFIEHAQKKNLTEDYAAYGAFSLSVCTLYDYIGVEGLKKLFEDALQKAITVKDLQRN